MTSEKAVENVPHIKIGEQFKLYYLYEFGEELGRGNFGIVHAATERKTSENVAIKIIHKSISDKSKMEAIQRELRILKIVDHPNIIKLHKIYESPRKIYLIFERCFGPLSAYYISEKILSEQKAKQIITQLFLAVAYLSKRGIIHRDIKMENILFSHDPYDTEKEWVVKLSDFGLSIMKTGSGVFSMLQQKTGTLAYMAPEMLTKEKYGELCDVWAIGIIFYMLLFGYHPFCSLKMPTTDIINGICNKELIFEEDDELVSEEAKEFLKAILDKNPLKRFTALEAVEHDYINSNKRRYPKKSSTSALNINMSRMSIISSFIKKY